MDIMTKTTDRYKDIPDLIDYPYEWAWNLHPTDKMIIVVYHWSKPVMTMFLGEAIEASSCIQVMKHIEECDNSPWLTNWQAERQLVFMEALTKDYENP